jgi:hypothetical protein
MGKIKLNAVLVLPKVSGNGHGGFFVGKKGRPKPKHIVEDNQKLPVRCRN